MANDRCGKCINCEKVEVVKSNLIGSITKARNNNSTSDNSVTDMARMIWNDTLRDYPCIDLQSKTWDAIEKGMTPNQ